MEKYINPNERLATCLNYGMEVCSFAKSIESGMTEECLMITECLNCRNYRGKKKLEDDQNRDTNNIIGTLEENISNLR